jgi:16S rRNA G966 N2-methylase RsmD
LTVILEAIKAKLPPAIALLVSPSQATWHIKDPEVVSIRDPTSPNPMWVVRVPIVTTNRALMLGQFQHFPVGGLSGFHPNFCVGFIAGYLQAESQIDLFQFCEVCLDVHEAPNATSDVYSYANLGNTVDNGLIARGSSLVELAEKYGIKSILVAGTTVSGFSAGMVEVLEAYHRSHAVESVLDMFSGTGALAKVCLANGAKRVTCVDVFAQGAQRELLGEPPRVSIVQADAFQFVPEQRYDLVILDPFFHQSLRVAQQIAPSLRNKAGAVVMNIGPVGEEYWKERVLIELRRHFGEVALVHPYESFIAVCQ